MSKSFLKEFANIANIVYNEYTNTVEVFGTTKLYEQFKLVQRINSKYCLYYADVNTNFDPIAYDALTKKELNDLIALYKKCEENKFSILHGIVSELK